MKAWGFVGREDELAMIERVVADARAGVPSVLLVGGDAGIGKSTLVNRSVEHAGIRRYLGRCAHLGGEVVPLAPLVDLVRQVRRSAPASWVDASELEALSHRLSPVTGSAPDAPEVGGVFGPVLELIARLAEQETVMVGFEDLHWADPMTWNLLEFLARNLIDEHVVLVGTYRTDDVWADVQLSRRLAELTRLPGVTRIHLEGLRREDVERAVTAMTGAAATGALVDDVLARGEGNPFFTQELVAAHLAGDAIPPVLSDLLAAEVAELDDQTRKVLAVLATIGRDVDHELLHAACEIDDDALEKSLRVAVDARVVVADHDTDAYRFRHALIGEVVYRGLLAPQRRRIHRRVADVLGQPLAPTAGADAAAELAFHLDKAGDAPAAFSALLAAVDAAAAVAPRTALGLLERALALWDEAGAASEGVSRSDRLWQAAELASGTVGNQRSVEFAREALTLGVPPLGEAWGHERLGRYLWTSGQVEESTIEFDKAAALLDAGGCGAEAAAALAGLAQAELMARDHAVAEHWCDRVFELVPAPDLDPLAWIMARRVLGVARGDLGHPDEAVALCREAVEAAPTAQTRALAHLYLASVLLDAGDCRGAVDVAVTSVAEIDLAGIDRSTAGYIDAVAAEALTRLGQWAEADAVLARHPEPDNLPVGEIRLGRSRAMLAARRGDRDRAEAALREAAGQPIDAWHQPLLDAAAGDVHLILGDWEQAARHAERGSLTRGLGSTVWAPRFAMLSTAIEVEQTLDAQARQETVDVAGTVRRLQDGIDAILDSHGGTDESPPLTADGAAHLAFAVASLTRLSGPDPDAWEDAARRWEQLPDVWLAATARIREAEAAVATGDVSRASSSLQEAQRAAAALGAAPLLDTIAAIARRSRLSAEPPPPTIMAKTSIEALGLTPREGEVLALIADGRTNRELGEALFISEKTASVHVSNILRKLGVTSRVDAAAIAQRLGAS